MVGNLFKMHPNCLDLQNPLMMGVVFEDLNRFYEENGEIKYNVQNVFSLVTLNTIRLFADLLELKERGIKIVDSQWKDFYKVINGEDSFFVESICDKWVSQLPNVYYEFYKNVFSRNNEYRYENYINRNINKKDNEKNILDEEIKKEENNIEVNKDKIENKIERYEEEDNKEEIDKKEGFDNEEKEEEIKANDDNINPERQENIKKENEERKEEKIENQEINNEIKDENEEKK